MLTVKLKSDEKTWKDGRSLVLYQVMKEQPDEIGRAEWSALAANSRQLATLIWHNVQLSPVSSWEQADIQG